MNILKIIHGYPPYYNAGSEVYSQSICDELSKHHNVTIFTREENPFLPDFHMRHEQHSSQQGIYYANMYRGKDGFRHPILDERFRKLVRDLKPDVAHIGHLNHLSTGLIDVLNEENIPIVFTLHDFWLMCPRGQFLQRNFGSNDFHRLCSGQENHKCATHCYSSYFSGKAEFQEEDERYWTRWIEQRMKETQSVTAKVTHFIAPSQYLLQRFVNEFAVPADKISYLDYGFPLHYLTPSTSPKKHKAFTLGYIGTHIPAKGVNQLIEAFTQIKGEAQLLIWGKKDVQSTQALHALASAVGTRIHFKGEYVNKHLADEVFAQVDAIVVPSIWGENSPLVIHEAQACHVPVITADFGGMAEYVQHQVNGLLFEHRNATSLSEQLSWAVEHPDNMKVLGMRGYLQDPEGRVPDIGAHCETLLSIYQQAIKHHATTLATNDRYES